MNLASKLKGKAKKTLRELLSYEGEFEDLAFIAGQTAALRVRDLPRLGCLWDAEFRVSSQWGEDGMIEWLVHSLKGIPETFVEFGVENYREANTRFLLQNRNWRGLVIDGSERHVDFIRRDRVSWRHDLTAVASFITRENINSIISGAGFAGEIGILSIDIDGVDYWVWEAIDCVNPQIIIVEYNSSFGDQFPLTVPYSPDFVRRKAHYSNLYFGLSIQAARVLAEKRGYTLIGTNRNGSNAFFVRDDRAAEILGRMDRVLDCPARFRESRGLDGQLMFTSPARRAEVLIDLPVLNISTGSLMPLGQIQGLFSARWQKLLLGGASGG